jgi:putative transposase
MRGDVWAMPDTQAATSRTRCAYDHRLRNQVVKTGTRCLPEHIRIPRSTLSTWQRRGQRPVVTIEPFDQDRQQLVDTIAKLDRRVRILAAVVRILLALLRASGFTLAGERLPEGAAKTGILRAITSAKAFLPLAVILRIAHLEPGRYHRWNRASMTVCGLDDRSSCPKTSPSQLTPVEVANIKDMVLAPEKRHMSLRTLAMHAQRIGKVFASATTWAKLVRARGWLRPRKRVHPPKPTVGVRAAAPNEIWHVDVSVLKLLDGTRHTCTPSLTTIRGRFSRGRWLSGSIRQRRASFFSPLASTWYSRGCRFCLLIPASRTSTAR